MKVPKSKGNSARINQQGQAILENILNNPNKIITKKKLPKFGNIIDIKVPEGYGARYYKNGKFIGFLEP